MHGKTLVILTAALLIGCGSLDDLPGGFDDLVFEPPAGSVTAVAPTATATAAATPTPTATEAAPTATATPELPVTTEEIEWLARLAYLECSIGDNERECVLGVTHTVFLRMSQMYLSDGTLRGTLTWHSGDTWQFPPTVVYGCTERSVRCPDGVDLSQYRQHVTDYLTGARPARAIGFHYGSVEGWPYLSRIEARDGSFIGWFSHWHDYPLPAYCASHVTSGRNPYPARWPVEGREIIGWHNYAGHGEGVDLVAAAGDAVTAALPGRVVYASPPDTAQELPLSELEYWYGNMVIVVTPDEVSGTVLVSLYAHLAQAPYLARPDWINAGEPVGVVGNTGNSRDGHLHFEARLLSARPGDEIDVTQAVGVNPLAYLCN